MSQGIALQMRRKFGQVTKLRKQYKLVNYVAFLNVDDRMIFYLITKQHHWRKRSYHSIFFSLQKLKSLCEFYQILYLTCLRLGYCLDGIRWKVVRNMLCYFFKNS